MKKTCYVLFALFIRLATSRAVGREAAVKSDGLADDAFTNTHVTFEAIITGKSLPTRFVQRALATSEESVFSTALPVSSFEPSSSSGASTISSAPATSSIDSTSISMPPATSTPDLQTTSTPPPPTTAATSSQPDAQSTSSLQTPPTATSATDPSQPTPPASSLPNPEDTTTIHTGDLTYYDASLGACGWTNTNDEAIVAVSQDLYDVYTSGTNPNNNSLCGLFIKIMVTWPDGEVKSSEVKVVDRCTGCKPTDLDIPQPLHVELVPNSEHVGRAKDMRWQWVGE